MHKGALNRMRELVRAAIDTVVLNDERMTFSDDYKSVIALADFISRNFAEYTSEALGDVYYTLYRHVGSLGLLAKSGALAETASEVQRNELADKFCGWWDRVPRKYQFVFPLPIFETPPEHFLPVRVGTRATLDRFVFDKEELLSRPLNYLALLGGGLGGARAPHALSLLIESKGICTQGGASESAMAAAIRAAKVFVVLGRVVGVLSDRPPTEQLISTPSEIVYTDLEDGGTRRNATPPGRFLQSLAKFRLVLGANETVETVPGSLETAARFAETLGNRLKRVGQTFDNAAMVDVLRRKNNPTDEEKEALEVAVHCGRLATAAEWLFDAESDAPTATAFLQVAIAFETLYGAEDDEPITETLANRVAYTLGKSPTARGNLYAGFREFYRRRSKIVHTGASRLSAGDLGKLRWGKEVLESVLRHEISLLPPDKDERKREALVAALRARTSK